MFRENHRNVKGSSLVELLVTITIFSIFATVAIPNVVALKSSFDRHSGKGQVEFAIRRARNEAIAKGTRAVLQFARDGGSYSFGYDYSPYNTPPAEDIVSYVRDLPSEITAIATQTIIFNSQGNLVDQNGDLTQLEITLSYLGHSYCSGTVLATGDLDYAC